MTLAPGVRLGGYEVLAPLGAGGMGEVYRARDSKLGRDVAVKVLPESWAHDGEALARFEREARAVAALSHPGILAIHELGRHEGTAFAVMELLEGVTLRERLREGPLPPRKAVEHAREIAQGLAAAHDKGIVHRDLKPENLFVTKGGRVKILDFGLARVGVPAAGDSDSRSPTMEAGTEPGTVLGTVGYMAPEQVRGRPADARSDIFAFGAVLFEMLTGRRAFHRETAAETMTAILREDPPDLALSGAHVPPGLQRVVALCLEKEPDDRFRTAHDLALALDAAGSGTAIAAEPALPSRARRLRAPFVAGIAATALLAGLGLGWLLRRAPVAPMVAVRPLTYSGRDTEPAVSPDGRTLAFTSARDGTLRVWLKQLTTGDELALTAGVDHAPRFSPDGSQVLFVRGAPGFGSTSSDLYRVSTLGGEPRKVASQAEAADWSPDGLHVVFTRRTFAAGALESRLFTIASEGGEPKEIARLTGRAVARPRFSPDGASISFASVALGDRAEGFHLVPAGGGPVRSLAAPPTLGSVSSGVLSADRKTLLYVQSLLARFGSSRLVAQDVASGAVRPLLWLPFEAGVIDALPGGRLVADGLSTRENLSELRLGGAGGRSRWLTRGTSVDRQPVFSPDGEWLAFCSNRSGNLDIWVVSTKTGALKRVTEDAADDWDPGFTPDGKLIWSSARGGHLEIWTADLDGGSARQVSSDGEDAENPTVTPDGWVVYETINQKKLGIWKVRLDGSKATFLFARPEAILPEVSPDGRFIAYSQPYAGPIRFARVADGTPLPLVIETPHVRVTQVPMGRPRWTRDGKRVFFIAQDEHGVNGVFAQDFDEAKPDTSATRLPVGGFDPEVETESLALSPDGARLVIAGLEQHSDLVTIEGLSGMPQLRGAAKAR